MIQCIEMYSQLIVVASIALTLASGIPVGKYVQDVIGSKEGASVGVGLRSIAQGSAEQAHNAVQNQRLAANQAAYVAKNTLAQAATGASATVQAALAGKQVLLQGLEQQLHDVKVALEWERQQLRQAERAADSSQRAARQAAQHVNTFQAATNAAQEASEQTNRAAAKSAGELSSQESMVGAAEQRLEQITKQFHAVLANFTATRAAAAKAEAAAREAQSNASRAAAAASVDYDHGVHQSGGENSDYY